MNRASGKTKLNLRNISIGHADTDPYIEVENSFERRTTEEEISQPKEEQSKGRKDEEHIKAFEIIYRYFNLFAPFLGIHLRFDWIPHRHIMFWFTCFLILFIWINIFYTQVKHVNNGDTLRVLEACAIYGQASSSTQKITGYIKHRFEINNLFLYVRRLCRKNLPGSRGDILKSHFINTLAFLKLFTVGVALCVGFFLACPLKAFIVDKEYLSLLPIEIVFVDQSTSSGFITANCVMIVLGSVAAFGLVIYDAVFIFAIFVYGLKVDLIEQDLKDLNEMWTDKSIVPLAYKHAFLTNICKKRQDLNLYMVTVTKIFEEKLFYYFIFNYFSQIICLFEVAKNQWTPGYAIALVLFIEMMFYCVMGTKITIADEKLFTTIYTTNWYTYDLYSQKIIILLLHHSEKPNELKLGPIGSLNVITGIAVIKSIYSYYTIITELL